MYKHLMCSILQYHNIVLFSALDGAQWCFINPLTLTGDGSTCEDIKTTQMGPYQYAWSYEACATPALGSPECKAA